ncbi:acyl-CoA N-acyltransferase [Stachybotrys elegans]|uniref:Acyl-CoA N-acyltransferase n=1 Tax=Stachybotrys elegans TaxID=80388 RepID=A0A8K0SZC4_9HYPO|nr:acyl-CoA N-acyltransferase [Stachybotrys elegans]
MPLQLRRAVEKDIPGIVQATVASFHADTDIISSRLFPSHLRPAGVSYEEAATPWWLARFTLYMKAPRPVFVVVTDDELNGEIVGFAMWERPVSGSDAQPLPYIEPVPGFDEKAFEEMKEILGKDVLETFGPDGDDDLWCLGNLGVHPRHQGRGVGKLLLRWGMEQAAAEGKDCHLVATPAGFLLYKKSGFEVLRELSILGGPHYSMVLRHSSQA